MKRFSLPGHRAARGFSWTSLGMYGGLAMIPVVGLTAPESRMSWVSLVAILVLGVLAPVAEVAFAARAGWHPTLDRRTRHAWRVIGAAQLVFVASLALRLGQPIGTGFPAPADVLRLVFGVMVLVGLVLLPLGVASRWDRPKVWLDTGIVMIVAGMVMWYLEIEPTLTGRPLTASVIAAALAYPAGDLAMVFAAVLVIVRGATSSARRPALLMTAGILCHTAADIYVGYQASHATHFAGLPWQNTLWMSGAMLFCIAGYEQCRLARRHSLTQRERPVRPITSMPYLAIGLGCALLAARAWQLHDSSLGGLVVGAVAMTGLAVGRQTLAQREMHQLAVTDSLTLLVNRKRLQDQLRLALARSARSGQHVAVLMLDMDGFKQVNDTLGHEAGDQLLVAFARLLQHNVLGGDVVGRLGGDEFAVVLHNVESAGNAVAVAERITADMRHPVLIMGAPIQPRASIGIAIAGPGEFTDQQLMHHADLAMYRAKQTKATGYELYHELSCAATTPAPVTPGLATSDAPGPARSGGSRR